MIVTCEGCDTRFQLDDARVPAGGARVRCSRCKHAFLVLPEAPPAERAAHAAAEAAVVAASPTPEGVADDLPVPRPPPKSEDSEWQFAEARTPDPEAVRAPVPEPNPWEEVLEEDKPPEARELDTLGSPESWSFVSEEAPPLRSPQSAASHGSATAASPAAAARGARSPAAAPTAEVGSESVTGTRSRAIEAVGWAMTGILLLAIAHGIDWTGPPEAGIAGEVSLRDGVVAEDLSLRRLENGVLGPVLVIGGALVNRGSSTVAESELSVRVTGADGVASEARGRVPSAPHALRESPPAPEPSRADAPLVARLAPGERVPFEAVFAGPPAGDAQLELRLETAREEGVPQTPGEAEGPATATGDPSPPSPLPSSG